MIFNTCVLRYCHYYLFIQQPPLTLQCVLNHLLTLYILIINIVVIARFQCKTKCVLQLWNSDKLHIKLKISIKKINCSGQNSIPVKKKRPKILLAGNLITRCDIEYAKIIQLFFARLTHTSVHRGRYGLNELRIYS